MVNWSLARRDLPLAGPRSLRPYRPTAAPSMVETCPRVRCAGRHARVSTMIKGSEGNREG